MKFIQVNEVPDTIGRKRRLQKEFKEFMAMNMKIAKVDLSDHPYKSPRVAQECLCSASKRGGWPVTVIRRGDDIYFIRRDM